MAIPELFRELGISSATFYIRRANYSGMDASTMARLKELGVNDPQLKKMNAE